MSNLENILINRNGFYIFTHKVSMELLELACHSGLYDAVWRPDNIGATIAEHIIAPLTEGLIELTSNPQLYMLYAPSSDMYRTFLKHISLYLKACMANPNAKILSCEG